MEKIQENKSLLCKPKFSSAKKTSFFIKNTKNNLFSKCLVGKHQN